MDSTKKKFLLIILLVVLVVASFTPTPIARMFFSAQWWYYSSKYGGIYSVVLDEYYCTTDLSCKHEQGHSEDINLVSGFFTWYSSTPEFHELTVALGKCRKSRTRLSQLPIIHFVLRNTKDPPREIYANLYANVELGEYNTLGDLMRDYESQC